MVKDQKDNKTEGSETKSRTNHRKASELVSEPTEDRDSERFSSELGRSLDEAESHIQAKVKEVPNALETWHRAREVVEKLKPVPWFVWRISNYVFSRSGQINPVPEGMVIGLRRLLFAAASDPVLGSGNPVSNLRVALGLVRSDVIAAVSVIHAVCRKLATREFERIWRPIIDDALLRAQIGFFIGGRSESFGPGRGMLAGFSGRAGLAILIATGDLEQARGALEELASGRDIGAVGLEIYGCDPLQVSALLLSVSGCGKDAAFGVVSYVSKEGVADLASPEQRSWLACFGVCEKVRTGLADELTSEQWDILDYANKEDRSQLIDMARGLVREGSSWDWIA